MTQGGAALTSRQFTLLPSTVHLEKRTNVGTCDGGDVLEGLSNVRIGH